MSFFVNNESQKAPCFSLFFSLIPLLEDQLFRFVALIVWVSSDKTQFCRFLSHLAQDSKHLPLSLRFLYVGARVPPVVVPSLSSVLCHLSLRAASMTDQCAQLCPTAEQICFVFALNPPRSLGSGGYHRGQQHNELHVNSVRTWDHREAIICTPEPSVNNFASSASTLSPHDLVQPKCPRRKGGGVQDLLTSRPLIVPAWTDVRGHSFDRFCDEQWFLFVWWWCNPACIYQSHTGCPDCLAGCHMLIRSGSSHYHT